MKKVLKSAVCVVSSGIIFSVISVFGTPVVSAYVSCVNLTSDISYGATDSYSGGPVSSLQNFLEGEGYMNAAANGHFGPATLAAVISFQSAKGISSTGYVGPLTRAAISSISCVSQSAQTTSTVSTPPVSSNTTATSTSNVTAPVAGSTLVVGKTYNITWNGLGNTGYDIVLEDQNGLSQGFITPNMQFSDSYSWQAGTVLSGVTNLYSTVPSGTYQIDLRPISGGGPDLVSGLFTIVAAPLSVNYVLPNTASISANPTMVLYGSGFTPSAKVSVDGSNTARIAYTSPDGTVLVFPLPSGVTVGQHVVYVSTSYGTVPSQPFNVTQ